MPIRIPNEGEAVALNIFVGKSATENLRLRLFTNNVTPADSDVLATYTEAAGSGYANVLLTAASWVITEGAPSTAAYPQVTFTFTGALGDVYGYYLTGETSNKVRVAERFTAAPFSITANGDNIKVTLNLTLADLID